jgi:predicted nucleic acid-binding protein
MPAISDSSPLILLARVHRLNLLEDIFGQIFVPPAVWREVLPSGPEREGMADLTNATWIWQRRLAQPEMARELHDSLHPGEAEAIALASEMLPPVPLLVDDLKARRIAIERGLRVTGTAGILVVAKEKRLIDRMQPLLRDVMEAGLYLGDAAVQEVLRRAGE